MKRAVLGGLDDVRSSTSSNKEKQIGKPNISANNVKSFGNLLKMLIDAYPELLVNISEVG